MAMMSRRATAETQGEVQGISAMAMGLGQLFAPLLLTGTMAWFTADGAPVHFPGAAFIVAAVFGLLAIARSEEHTSELQSLMRISDAVFCLQNNKAPNPIHIN